jgi:hypothetical protein
MSVDAVHRDGKPLASLTGLMLTESLADTSRYRFCLSLHLKPPDSSVVHQAIIYCVSCIFSVTLFPFEIPNSMVTQRKVATIKHVFSFHYS